MYKLFKSISIIHCTLAVLLLETSLGETSINRSGHYAWDSERYLLSAMGLPADANDAWVVASLEEPSKTSFAIGVIRYRKITSASSRLLQMVNDKMILLPIRISAAHALCDFENKEWIKPMKSLIEDSNNPLDISSKIKIAGLQARVGDYSQFKILATHINDPKQYIRSEVVQALGNYREKERKEVLAAAELLLSVAKLDPQASIRRFSIESLEKIVQKRTDLAPKIVDAAQANIDSDDDSLKLKCQSVLMRWGISCLDAESLQPGSPAYCEKMLQKANFATDTSEQILQATKSDNYFIRYLALTLLTQRIGLQAKSTLKQALEDPHIKVRSVSAHLLGTLGDKSGLQRMQTDFAELVPRDGLLEPADPNIIRDPQALREWRRERHYHIRRALEVAKVLAELGDRQGYELSVRVGLETNALEKAPERDWLKQPVTLYADIRSLSVAVLFEIAKTDAFILASESRDPVSVLCEMAASEKHSTVFNRIITCSNSLGGNLGVRILEKAKDNPYQRRQETQRAEKFLKTIKKSDKTVEDRQRE